jgi:predicted N-acyltransferase
VSISDVPDLSNDYVTRVLATPEGRGRRAWNALLRRAAARPSCATNTSRPARQRQRRRATGWTPQFVTLWREGELQAACPLYLKSHSYGEYVFDWAWANAYEQHGVRYYPKALTAVPFTPVPGPRLLARDAARAPRWCAPCWPGAAEEALVLAPAVRQRRGHRRVRERRLMLRHTVQFHWMNASMRTSTPSSRASRRRSARRSGRSGARWPRPASPSATRAARRSRRSDWDFFYRCYERTYLEHGNPPYLTRDFFRRMAAHMPEHWLLFIASARQADRQQPDRHRRRRRLRALLGRAGARDCLHFEACYYQPLAWCMANGFARFEGGAQGEHKMARALMPVKTTSAHWLAHPAFADAVEKFLQREGPRHRELPGAPGSPLSLPPMKKRPAGRFLPGCRLRRRAASCSSRCRPALPGGRIPGLPSPAP